MSIPVEQQQAYIAIWSKVVDTQMHFNEMSVKSRQLGLTFVAAALGVSIVLLSRHEDFAYSFTVYSCPIQLHISVFLFLGALLALLAVQKLDLNVYHRMLRGAVTFGEDFEENYMKQVFSLNKGMTQAISHYSRFGDAYKETDENGKYVYMGNKRKNALEKLHQFYNYTNAFLIIISLLTFVLTNVPAIEYVAFGTGPAEVLSGDGTVGTPEDIDPDA